MTTTRVRSRLVTLAGMFVTFVAAACGSGDTTQGAPSDAGRTGASSTSQGGASASGAASSSRTSSSASSSASSASRSATGSSGGGSGAPDAAADSGSSDAALDAGRGDGSASSAGSSGTTTIDRACTAACAAQAAAADGGLVACYSITYMNPSDCQTGCVNQASVANPNSNASCAKQGAAMVQCESALRPAQWTCSVQSQSPIPSQTACTATVCAWACCVGSLLADPDIWTNCMPSCGDM